MKNELPLSWVTSEIASDNCEVIDLKFPHTKWISLAELSTNRSILDFLTEKFKVDDKILIRGCSSNLSEELHTIGFKRIDAGKEAVLNLAEDHFNKKSLRELIKRGLRHGKVLEIKYNNISSEKLNDLKSESAHSDEPQLSHLFHTKWEGRMRLFVFEENITSKWLGAISVSQNSNEKLQVELLVRRKGAPIGIMEALIKNSCDILKDEGVRFFSLGEVPFVNVNKGDRFSRLINFAGHLFRYAYNYKGLFNFKNKFNPHWENIYICVKPRLSLAQLFSMFLATNFLRLSIYKLIKTALGIFRFSSLKLALSRFK